jgi:hypothetical protein
VIRKLTALLEIGLLLSLAACSTTTAKKGPPPSDLSVTVTTPDQPSTTTPPAPSAPQAFQVSPKPETPSPSVPAPAPAPLPAPSVPGLTTPPKAEVVPAPEPQPSPPAGSAPDRGPAVRLRQAQTAPAPGQPPAQAPGRLVVFNFDNADIEIVLQATSELLVFNYVLAPEARGKKVTVQTTGRIPVDDIFPVLLTILDVNGLAAIKSGNVYRIIAKQGASQVSTRTVVGAQLDPSIPGDEVLTQVVP